MEQDADYVGKPNVVSFMPFFMPAIFIAGVSLYFLVEKQTILDALENSFINKTGMVPFYITFAIATFIPALAFALYKINLRYILAPVLSFIILLVVKHKFLNVDFTYQPNTTWIFDNLELLAFVVYGILSILNTELYRRSHRYEITDVYIKTSAGIFSSKERILILSKINDIAVSQSFFGKLFGYGSIIPVTASGMGMGFNFSAATGGTGMKWFKLPSINLNLTGGHAIQVPKTRTHEALIGIHNHKDTLAFLLDQIGKS